METMSTEMAFARDTTSSGAILVVTSDQPAGLPFTCIMYSTTCPTATVVSVEQSLKSLSSFSHSGLMSHTWT